MWCLLKGYHVSISGITRNIQPCFKAFHVVFFPVWIQIYCIVLNKLILNAVDRCSEGLRERALAEGWWQEGTVFNWAQVIGGATTGGLGYFSLAASFQRFLNLLCIAPSGVADPNLDPSDPYVFWDSWIRLRLRIH